MERETEGQEKGVDEDGRGRQEKGWGERVKGKAEGVKISQIKGDGWRNRRKIMVDNGMEIETGRSSEWWI